MPMLRFTPALILLASCSVDLERADESASQGKTASSAMANWCADQGYTNPAECLAQWNNFNKNGGTAAGGATYAEPMGKVSTAGTGTADDWGPDIDELMHHIAIQLWGEELMWMDADTQEILATFQLPAGEQFVELTQHPAFDQQGMLLDNGLYFVQTDMAVYQLNDGFSTVLYQNWYVGQY